MSDGGTGVFSYADPLRTDPITVNDFNDLVNRMRNAAHGRGVAPRIKDKKLLARTDKFVGDWRAWFKGPDSMSSSLQPWIDRYNKLRPPVQRASKIKLKAAPKSGHPLDRLERVGTAFAWGAGFVGFVYVLNALRK